MCNQNQTTRTDRTREFFRLGCWELDAANAWQHIVHGACDDEDSQGDKGFSALDMNSMFNEYRVFKRACNDAFNYLIDNVYVLMRIAGLIYIDCEGSKAGAVEFVDVANSNNHERAEWLFQCAQDGAGVLLRAMVDSTGAINIELAR